MRFHGRGSLADAPPTAGTWVFYELTRGPLALLRKLESLLNVSDFAPANATGKHTMKTEDE